MLKTPLYQFHVEAGGQMVEFAGWEMPIMYRGRGVVEEHKQTRRSGSLFDVSHMGRLAIRGRHARRLLERLCTRRISDMTAGQCRYSLMCNDRGGVRDDVIVYRNDDDDFLVVVNGANREKILRHISEVKGDLVFSLEDRTLGTAMVALQGPGVMDLIAKFSREIPTLKRYRFTTKNLLIASLIVSRTGYTGEDGVEVILPANFVGMAMKLLMKDYDPEAAESPIKPAGLGARDTLRLEAGMPLYGHELGEEMSALGAGLDFAISLDKDGDENGEKFVGMEALRAEAKAGGPARKLVGVRLEGKRTARQGMKVRSGGREVGEVTSACLSPTLGYPIAMAYVGRESAEAGMRVEVETGRGDALVGEVAALPFYKAGKAS